MDFFMIVRQGGIYKEQDNYLQWINRRRKDFGCENSFDF